MFREPYLVKFFKKFSHSFYGFLLAHPDFVQIHKLSPSFETITITYFKFVVQNFTTLLSLCLDSRFINHVCVLFFFFFFCFHAFLEECGYCSMNSSRKCWLFSVNSASVHCSRTHKFHFLSIFSLKMGPTALFTHLKIILLQWFQQ